MKTFDLNAYGVNEVSIRETIGTNGGGFILSAIAIIGAVIYVVNNWDDFVDGLQEGYAAYQSQ